MPDKSRTLFQKIWDRHLVRQLPDGACLLYIDRHVLHECTSAQAFQGLRDAGRTVRRPEQTLGVIDHIVPTTDRRLGVQDPAARTLIPEGSFDTRDRQHWRHTRVRIRH